ncbi:MAG: type II toxin-antitoxin system RelE/ParE family toxin [Candidatus Gastranaerophilales bacterium]|nr:type II toxin-antitoxin system RelE/ParE family toxin [Candidatus Gastranaerophilales bacterium]
MKEVKYFKLDNGKIPVVEWINSLDIQYQTRIYARITRLQEGNYGDCKKLGEISELRFKFGSGYRIYFQEVDGVILLLLNAGDKKTQSRDIEKAKEYLKIWKGL